MNSFKSNTAEIVAVVDNKGYDFDPPAVYETNYRNCFDNTYDTICSLC